MYTFDTFKKSVEFDAFAFDGASDTPTPVFETDTHHFMDVKQKSDFSSDSERQKEDGGSVTTASVKINATDGVVKVERCY